MVTVPLGNRRGVALTLLLCALASLCEGIDLQAAGVAAAGISAEFMPTAQLQGYFFGASTFGLFLGALLGGRLADVMGRKAVLVSSIAVFGLFSLVTPLAWSMPSLIFTRLLTGFGLGGAYPNLIALVSESSPERRRSANVALVYGAVPIGGALASLISLISAPEHWRWIFILGGAAPLLIAPVMARWLPESPAFARQRPITRARGCETALASDSPARASGGFAAILADGRALRTSLLWVSFFLSLLILYLLLNWLPTLLTGNGLSRRAAAAAQIGFNVGGAFAALLMGHLLEGAWRRISVVIAFTGLPLLLAVLAASPAQPAFVFLIVTLLGCTLLATQAFLYATAPACYPTAIRGVGVGAAVAIGRAGSIIGPTLAGTLVSAGSTASQLLLDLLPLTLVAGVCAIALVGLMPRTLASSPPAAH